MELQFRILKDLGASLLVHMASWNEGQSNWNHLGVICVSYEDMAALRSGVVELVHTSDIAVNITVQAPVEKAIN